MEIEIPFNRFKPSKNTVARGKIITRRSNSCAAILTFFLLFSFSCFAQQIALTSASAEFIRKDGLTVERLIELGRDRRTDLKAARERLAIAEGKLLQAGLRPNPTLSTEFGSPRFLGGEAESNFSVGISQTFETGGKRTRRTAVAELELNKVRAEVIALERQLSVSIRNAYSAVIANARQLDVLDGLIKADDELVRVIEARLKEGDVAPLDVNLVKVEADRLKIQAIQAKADLETQLLQLKNLTGFDVLEDIRIAPQADRPPRLDLGVSELTEIAFRERSDLTAARLGEQLGSARVDLAKANATPNIAGSIGYSRNKQIIDLPPVIGGNTINRDNELKFGLTVDLPVFNRNQGEIASAAAEKTQATREREFLETTIKRDVAISYRKYRAASETLVLYSTQIMPRAEANLKSVRAAYGFGDFSVFDVVSEQRRLTENVTGYNQALSDYYSALAELEAAIGIAIPVTGFTPGSESVIPDKIYAPTQIDQEKFLRSIQTIDLQKKSVLTNLESKKEN